LILPSVNRAPTSSPVYRQNQQDATLGIAGGQAYRDGTVTLKDFVQVQKSEKWGDRFVQGSLRGALANAGEDAG